MTWNAIIASGPRFLPDTSGAFLCWCLIVEVREYLESVQKLGRLLIRVTCVFGDGAGFV